MSNIDTSTTAGKIAVMGECMKGNAIQQKYNSNSSAWAETDYYKGTIIWNWAAFDYRIKPKTLQEAAEEYFKNSYMNSEHQHKNSIINDFKKGAQWQKDNGNV